MSMSSGAFSFFAFTGARVFFSGEGFRDFFAFTTSFPSWSVLHALGIGVRPGPAVGWIGFSGRGSVISPVQRSPSSFALKWDLQRQLHPSIFIFTHWMSEKPSPPDRGFSFQIRASHLSGSYCPRRSSRFAEFFFVGCLIGVVRDTEVVFMRLLRNLSVVGSLIMSSAVSIADVAGSTTSYLSAKNSRRRW